MQACNQGCHLWSEIIGNRHQSLSFGASPSSFCPGAPLPTQAIFLLRECSAFVVVVFGESFFYGALDFPMGIGVCMCVYIYIYTHIYTRIYIYIYYFLHQMLEREGQRSGSSENV